MPGFSQTASSLSIVAAEQPSETGEFEWIMFILSIVNWGITFVLRNDELEGRKQNEGSK